MVIEGLHYSPNCSCKNCKRIKIMDEKVSLRNEWNLALLRYAEKVGTEGAPESRRRIVADISQAIATAVSNREKEIAEEVKESFWECPVHGEPNPPTDCRDCNECLEVNVVLSNVLQIIKH